MDFNTSNIVKENTGDEDNNNDDDDDDDDDLMAPPAFLQREKPNILTPCKGSAPQNDTLSPLDTILNTISVEKGSRKARFSLTSLLCEKEKLTKIECAEQEIKDLASEFQDGGIMRLVDEEHVENSQIINESQDSIADSLSQSQFLDPLHPEEEDALQHVKEGEMHDFPITYPGVEIFIHSPPENEKFPDIAPVLRFMLGGEADLTELNGYDQENMLDVLLLCSHSIGFPHNVAQFFWNVITTPHCDNYLMVALASKTLKDYYNKQDEEKWLPSPIDFVAALSTLGAEKKMLKLPSQRNKDTDTSSDQELNSSIKRTNRKLFHKRTVNAKELISLVTHILDKHPLKYSTEHLNHFLEIGFCLCLEKLLMVLLWDVKCFISAVLDSYSSTQWKDEIQHICFLLTSSTAHHRNLLQIIQTLPPTNRGTELLPVLAFHALRTIMSVEKPTICADYCPSIQAKTLFVLILPLKVHVETDFHQLYTMLNLIGLILSAREIKPTEKRSLGNVIAKLKSLNGEIKDGRGMFLNRTKCKDVIIRLISKYKFISQSLQTQRHLDSYFDRTRNNDSFSLSDSQPSSSGYSADEESEPLTAERESSANESESLSVENESHAEESESHTAVI